MLIPALDLQQQHDRAAAGRARTNSTTHEGGSDTLFTVRDERLRDSIPLKETKRALKACASSVYYMNHSSSQDQEAAAFLWGKREEFQCYSC